jgi:hypothetical protein
LCRLPHPAREQVHIPPRFAGLSYRALWLPEHAQVIPGRRGRSQDLSADCQLAAHILLLLLFVPNDLKRAPSRERPEVAQKLPAGREYGTTGYGQHLTPAAAAAATAAAATTVLCAEPLPFLAREMDPFSLLSADQLEQVLSHVPIKHRLSTCSLVSTTWCTAAARATTSIKVKYAAPSFGQWLRSHSAAVQVSSLKLTEIDGSELCLPAAQLQSLQELHLDATRWSPAAEQDSAAAATSSKQDSATTSTVSSTSSKQGLERLPALTSLKLRGSSVRLAGLSTLTCLQELECNPELSAAPLTDLMAAFPQLQRLTSLTLCKDIASTAVVAQISTLQSLQRLELEDPAADSFEVLPQSLTQLNLLFRRASSLTRSNGAGLSQLTALRSLYLRNVQPLDLSLLSGMRDLRSLWLWGCEFAAGDTNLQVLSSLTALTLLTIEGQKKSGSRGRVAPGIYATSAEATALTALSQLVELTVRVEPASGQLQDCGCLFPPGLQLQHLTVLDIRADLLSSTAAYQRAVSCCPGLRKIFLKWPDNNFFGHLAGDEPVAAIPWQEGEQDDRVAAGLAAWSGLRGLRELWLTARAHHFPVWSSLATLTQLTKLAVHLTARPGWSLQDARDDVLQLAACRQLRSLSIYCERTQDCPGWRLLFDSTVRDNPGRHCSCAKPSPACKVCGGLCKPLMQQQPSLHTHAHA